VWTAGARTLFVTVDASFPLAVEEVRAALDESSAVALEPPAALESVAFAYPDFGEPGEVVERAYVEDLDLWLVRFANGVRLNLKRTAFEKQSVRFSLRFGTGRLEEPAAQPGLHLWLPALIYGGLGRQSYADMSRALTGRGVNVSAHTGLDAFEFSGDARTADLPTNLQVLAAYIADPGFRPEGRERALAGLYSFYNALRQSPELVFRLAIEPYLAGGDPRFGTPPRNKVENYTIDDLRAWIGPALKNGPVEIGIIGDIDIDATIDAVARTLGTLPARAPKPSLADRRVLKFPEAPQSKLHTYTATARPATLAFYWPVHDALTTATKRHLLLLAGVFEDRLRVKIREEKGETYSPDADFNASDAYPGDARISCRLDVRPDRAKKVGESVRDIARSLARDGVTEEELQRAKAQALAAAQQMVRDNGFWLETVLGDVQERPGRLGEIRTLEEDFANATKADLDALCARYLGEKNLLRYIIEAKAPKR
jgi:zinc protease